VAPHVDQAHQDERLLRITGVVFLIALLVHAADHLRRGFDVLTPTVFWAGNLQLTLGIVTLVLVFRGHRWGPAAAVAIGFTSAVGFTAAHLLPHWSTFSDSFTGAHPAPGVTGFSWFAALFEIGADLAFGWAGWRVYRSRGTATTQPRGASLSA
jgi:hypothetical protein